MESWADYRAMKEAVRAAVRAGQALGFDSEWDAPDITHRGKRRPDPLRAKLVGFSIAVPGRPQGWYVPASPNSVEWLRRLLACKQARVFAHNFKSELHVLRNAGIFPACSMLDSELLAWLAGWRLAGEGGLKLKALCAARFGTVRPDFRAVAKGRQASAIPVAEIAPYAAADAVDTLRLGTAALEACADLDLLREQWPLDAALIPVTAEMERAGFTLDEPRLLADATRCESELVDIEAKFYDLTRTTVLLPTKVKRPKACPACFVNPVARAPAPCPPGCVNGVLHFKNGKPKLHTVLEDQPVLRGAMPGRDSEVSRWLFDELKFWPSKGHPKTANGWSVAEEDIRKFTALEGPAGEAARLRLRYQALRKYASTYTRNLVGLARQSGDGRLHAGFKQDGTKSQRYSSSGPNLQNLPASERAPWLGELPDIRASFIAAPGKVLIVRDWSQLELRLAAHFSQDANLLRIYRTGGDVHAETMVALGCQRKPAKTVNFSVIYRITAPTLARKISLATNDWAVTREQAQAWIDGFYAKYPGVMSMQEEFIDASSRHGYATCIGGFKAPIEGVRSVSPRARRYAENQACNLPIQGSAGVIAKRAMRGIYALHSCLGGYGDRFALVAQVHDELVVEADEAIAHDLNILMETIMSSVAPELSVPLVSSGGIGKTWAEAKCG